VREGLTRYEPRIDVLDVTATAAPERENLLLIRVSYRVRANNAIGNLVYPFYIREAG
jgi:phage baseplate assembly protein W